MSVLLLAKWTVSLDWVVLPVLLLPRHELSSLSVRETWLRLI
jgi:hypothetical protein